VKKRTVDARLRATLQSFSESWAEKRAGSFEAHDFEALRTRLAERKDEAIARSGELLGRFEEEARRHGSTVLRAKDGDEANRFIADILEAHGARSLVKSKSMVSEETRLNAFLSRRGISPRETDLGEWIVQLAGEAPTHMVMPAIHFTRTEVAELFSDKLGCGFDDDIPSLVRIAREELRREILRAPAGLTGANALIAENGGILLVTNEGNGRLVSTVPPLHIVLASTEKILETTADALLLLKILTKNATGQPISSYASFIAGPHREHQTIVLLDNHRSELGADPRFREVLRCIKCSACLNVCPVYQVVGGESFSHVYMGGIGSLLTAWIHGLENSSELAGLCLGCHRCEEVCATKIPIADLVAALKERLVERGERAFWKRIALDGVMGHPAVNEAAFKLGRAVRPVLHKKGFARRLPPGLRKYDRFRALPAPARKSLSRLLEEGSGRNPTPGGTGKGPVVLFPGCLVQNVYPEIGTAAAEVLGRLGYEVVLGPTTCCGFPQWNSGHSAAARRAFRSVYRGTPEEGPVVTLCPTCTSMLARIGPASLEPRDVDGEALRRFSGRVVPFSRFVARREGEAVSRLLAAGRPGLKVTYHDSCHHRFVLGASEDSRELLRAAIKGDLLEMSGPSSCCGFAGAFSVDHPEVSEALAADRGAAIRATGAETVALDCPGCLLQIRGACFRGGMPVEVRHTAEILRAALEE
jgi:iron-sulfur cluster protein